MCAWRGLDGIVAGFGVRQDRSLQGTFRPKESQTGYETRGIPRRNAPCCVKEDNKSICLSFLRYRWLVPRFPPPRAPQIPAPVRASRTSAKSAARGSFFRSGTAAFRRAFRTPIYFFVFSWKTFKTSVPANSRKTDRENDRKKTARKPEKRRNFSRAAFGSRRPQTA